MSLPFSHDAFLDVFGRYNSRLWPAVVLLWVVTALMVMAWLCRGRLRARPAFALLAFHWAWSAVAYHWLFFRRINQAAAVFAALFLVQAAAFAWMAVRNTSGPLARGSLRGVACAGFAVYGLAYPFIGLALGLQYPRLPLFAVPCPSLLVTTGILLAAPRVPRKAYIIPFLWAVIGSTAAFALGIRADVALVAAAIALAAAAVLPWTDVIPKYADGRHSRRSRT